MGRRKILPFEGETLNGGAQNPPHHFDSSHSNGGESLQGALKGNANALRHGYYTGEAIDNRQEIRRLVNEMRSVLSGFQ
jgi:hypothetical protein